MAKKNLGRLAGLAALAGAAYMASKGKDKDDAGDQKTSSYTGDTKKVEDKEEPRRQITDYMKKSDGDSKPITEADVVMPEQAAPKTATAPRTSTTAKTDSLGVKAPASGNSADKLASLSRSTIREAKTKQFAQDVPYQESAAKTDAMMAASRAARQADARKRALSAGTMKKGGAVKKMASGGMTASKRADGIASRGKTNCKMY